MRIAPYHIKKIAVFRVLQLGDMLCAIPAIRALHHAYPQAAISLVGLPWAGSFVNRFHNYFHSFIRFPGYPGLPEQKFTAPEVTFFLHSIQEMQFDLVLQMQGNGTIINPFISLFDAKYTAGFYRPGDFCPDPDLCMLYPEGIHEIERHLALMQHLGIRAADTRLEFPVYKKDLEDFAALHLPYQPGEYFCIHPGARAAWRRWPPVFFAALAQYCAGMDYRLVITGSAEEIPVINEVKKNLKADAFIAAGSSLGALAVLLKNAAGLVSNCTGVSHIAAALETPSLIISMDGEAERWAPLNKELHRVIDWTRKPGYDTVYEALEKLLHDIKEKHIRNNGIIPLDYIQG